MRVRWRGLRLRLTLRNSRFCSQMRIGVVSQIHPGSLRAHAINVIKTAGGFARLGHDVHLYTLCPTPDAHGANLAATYHEPSLHWVLATGEPDAEAFGRWAAQAIISDRIDIVYARNFCAPLLTAAHGTPTVVESHAYVGSDNALLDRTLAASRSTSAMRAIITIAPRLRDDFIARGAAPHRVHIVPDGVDYELFTSPTANPFTASPGPHIVYSGHLYDYKGIPTILEAASLLPTATFHLVGGLPQDIERHRGVCASRQLQNVVFHGSHAHGQVPPFVQHADVLLLPPSAQEASKDWTSPVKLGEYLATGRPMVVSAIAALRRVLPESLVEWCTPDDAASMVLAIRRAIEATREPSRAQREGEARRLLAHRLSYVARARRIMAASNCERVRRAA
jgi:glycosyltransferase involved in cell wall biosynthesis